VTKIVKVVSGDTPETLATVKEIYGSIITAGVYPASNIKVAEAAKVIENTQRDLNIALMNELAIIFDKIGIDTLEVLQAAGTKWNFLPFRPGLVGGHCIGVDPYYLTHKAQKLGYHPEVILAGRRINDGMGKFIAEKTIKQLIRRGHPVKDCPIIVLGLTFKEDCPDLRNSRVSLTLFANLNPTALKSSFMTRSPTSRKRIMNTVSISSPGKTCRRLQQSLLRSTIGNSKSGRQGDFLSKLHQDGVITDVKSMFDAAAFAGSGIDIWRL
jgi:UDP-N-acetyl-D-galactosamine dehydrogenase